MKRNWVRTLAAGTILAFLASGGLSAATYYIAPPSVGSDTTGNGSYTNPWATLNKGMASMRAGDTLICRDGVYTGDANTISGGNGFPPKGSAGAWTVIKAEHDGEAVFDGQNARNMFYVWGGGTPDPKYWQFEGLVWCRTPDNNVGLYYASYVKFLRCGAFDVGPGNIVNFGLGRVVDYILLESCYAYGTGRYKFLVYGGSSGDSPWSRRVILRNCVARNDIVDASSEPLAAFSIYNSNQCLVQNCIAIDCDQTNAYSSAGRWGGFYVVANGLDSTNIAYTRCIVLNSAIGGLQADGAVGGDNAIDIVYRDCVVWNARTLLGQGAVVNLFKGIRMQSYNGTYGVSNQDAGYFNSWYGGNDNSTVLKNNIVYNITGSGPVFKEVETEDYNCIYGCTNIYDITAAGAHSMTSINPVWSAGNPAGALKYIVRTEAGNSLAGRARAACRSARPA
jgi:hypothetical protein